MTLKAYQKIAVQSYFERQQQQHQQTPQSKELIKSHQAAKLRLSQTSNATNGTIAHKSNLKCAAVMDSNGLSLNESIVIRSQLLPVNKLSTSMDSILQTRLSLPNKLSQIINLTTQLTAQKQTSNANNKLLGRPTDRTNPPKLNSPSNSQTNQTQRSTVVTVEKNNLQSINESGVPPPPKRKINCAVIPVRR